MGHSTVTSSSTPRSGRRVLIVVGLVLIVTAVPAIIIPTYVLRPSTPRLDDFGAVPAFAFTDETNAAFTTEAMRGNVSIVNFIFTRCGTVCPASSIKMLDVQERTVDLPDRIKLVSFSVDPEYDTPAVLASYAREYHADPRRWRFVTGPIAPMRQVIEGAFMTGMDKRGVTPTGAPDIWHGQKFLLVDQRLRIRGIYEADAPGLDRLTRHARYLARRGP